MAEEVNSPGPAPEEGTEPDERAVRDGDDAERAKTLAAGAAVGAAVAIGETPDDALAAPEARTRSTVRAEPSTPTAGRPAVPGTGTPTVRSKKPADPGTDPHAGPPDSAGTGGAGPARTLGLGAAAGLGGVAAAGLLSGGHADGHAPSSHTSHQGPVHPGAGVPPGPGDQGYTPLDPGTASLMQGSDPGSPGKQVPDPAAQSPTAAGTPSTHGHHGTDPASPQQDTVGWTGSQDTRDRPYDTSSQPLGGEISDRATSADAAPTVLYDSSGHPAGTVDDSGRFSPISGGTPSSDAPGSILYDASGNPVATTDASGNVVPLSAERPATGTDATAQGAGQDDTTPADGVQPRSATQTPGGEPTYTYDYTYPEMTDDQRLWYDPLSLTPEQRDKILRDEMAKNGVKLPPADGKDIPLLPDSFWQKDGYDVNGQHLTPVEAAATIYGIASSFSVNVNELGTLAGHMDDLYQTLSGAWAKLYGKIADLKVDDVFGDDENLADFHQQYTDTTNSHSDAALQVMNGLTAQAGGLRQTASAYIQQENANLAPFGVTAVDPRSAMDQARYQNGQDMSDHYPYWYFDTSDPRSPFFKKS
ncbi:hypothetical protein [Actinoallomurus iriomotensis]|uniref:Uncharacterized protein n=1 Tax=Actinoallomurus iriomotensis TaxID=478107 RepID=A0A9W6VR67_9ACTN|nr:hypothetical protein [Actinoallomurus iriomotensis]GLY81893.1 hypothetical protein Airi01_101600 [Actinoallomurus iriomotensis]